MITIISPRYLPRLNNATALAVLFAGTAHLSWNYHTSAAFEYPIVFSLFTIIGCAGASLLIAIWTTKRRIRLRTLVAVLREAPLPPLWWPLLVLFVVGRTLLLGITLDKVQCSVEGVYAFLPALLPLLDATSRRTESETLSYYKESSEDPLGTSRPSSPSRESKNDELPKSRANGSIHNARTTRRSLAQYIMLALAWGFFAHQTLAHMTRTVGSVCPTYSGWDFSQLIPAGQVLMLVLDALVIGQVVKMQRFDSVESNTGSTSTSTNISSWVSLCTLSLSSAVVLVGAVFGIYPAEQLFGWAPAVRNLIIWDLIRESAVATAVLIAAVSLLSSAHPATIAAITGAVGLFFHYVKQVKDEKGVIDTIASTGWWQPRYLSVLAIALSFFLVRSESRLPRPTHHHNTTSWTRQRWLTLCYVGLVVTLLLSQTDRSAGNTATVLSGVIDRAQKASVRWMQDAVRSHSLQEAVSEYRLRYGIPPPPHFDKWYEFATKVNSPIIDSFDQIHNDLLPFWGIAPAHLRRQTTHLLEQTHLGIGGFRIKNHEVKLSPLTPGTHFWMMEGFRAMVEPFLEWLPDMDLAFNLDDECRVVVPFQEVQRLTEKAQETRKRIEPRLNSFSSALTPPWGDTYMGQDYKEAHANDPASPYFSIRASHDSIYDLFIAPTCPSSSPALTSRWWSHREGLPSGQGIVTDPAAAVDLCQRPDIARMHGFLLDPGAFGVSRTLLPIFSQGRIPGFNDILVPSPWNFMSKVDINDAADEPWATKSNSIFWRGGSTDGLSRTGDWTVFLRTRFAWLAKQFTPRPSTKNDLKLEPIVNVSFVGNFRKCVRPDCLAQSVAFYGAPEVENPPGGMDFQEHWVHRHLVDLDGAGFSGRFIPFMKSRSLVYRVSLFRTWYDERVHAWQHYVPLDVSLGDTLWGLVKLLVGGADGGGEGQDVGGDLSMSAGEKIALNGRDWARKALRKEDMQVYFFRLLLEWARLIDDKREELGFVVV